MAAADFGVDPRCVLALCLRFGNSHLLGDAHFDDRPIPNELTCAEARPPQRLDHWQVFVRNATWIESIVCEFDAAWGSSGPLVGKLSVPWMWARRVSLSLALTLQDIEPIDMRGKTNSGAAAYVLCPIPSDWVERMWLNTPGPPDSLPGPVTARISLRLRDTLLPYRMPPYKLIPRPALPKRTVGGAFVRIELSD